MYRFIKQEILLVDELRERFKIKVKTPKILRLIFFISTGSIDKMIEVVYRKAIAGQFIGRGRRTRRDSFPRRMIIKENDDVIITLDIIFRRQ